MRRERTLLAGSACALLLSCSTPTGICACPPARTHALVYGSVRSADGVPVAGAQVQAAVFSSVCGQGVGEVDPDANPVSSDATGAYRLRFHSLHGPRAACVRVTSRSAGAADGVVVDAAVALRSEAVEPDSIRVDLVLP